MKVRERGDAGKIELQMTPMIDIVFQLLVFFIMTFNIVEIEGDFNILMPGAPAAETLTDVAPTKLKLRMTADAAGELKSLSLDGRKLNAGSGSSVFDILHDKIRGVINDHGGPGAEGADFEVEIACDYSLKYNNVIEAITAVSGERDQSTGEIITLIEKIRFSQPVGGPE